MEFKLNENEQQAAKMFRCHCEKDKYYGAIGGNIYYKFHVTGIGDAVSIGCDACHHEENITDYGSW